jgi:hypothetical protein
MHRGKLMFDTIVSAMHAEMGRMAPWAPPPPFLFFLEIFSCELLFPPRLTSPDPSTYWPLMIPLA